MGTGEQLRTARIARGMTIEQLSDITKISISTLRAIEANDFERVPGGVFVRGFLRAYAREVGLAPEQVVAAYLAEYATPAIASDGNADEQAEAFSSRENEPERFEESDRVSDLGQMIAIAVIVVAAVGYLGLHNRSSSVSASASSAPRAPAPPRAVTSAAAQAVPVGTSGVVIEGSPAEPALQLDIEATGPCWVAATPDDGTPAVQRLMNAGERVHVAARELLTLRIGDPAAVRFALNGAPGRSLGDAGRAVTVRMTPQNYREYLAR